MAGARLFYWLNYCWRVFATGFSFLIFALIGALISLVLYLYSWIHVSTGTRQRQYRVRRVISRIFRLYLWMMKCFGLLRYEFDGLDNLIDPGNITAGDSAFGDNPLGNKAAGGKLIVANHPSLLDVVFLIALIDRANCVVKASLWESPLTAAPVRAAGYIKNTVGAAEPGRLLADCLASLDQGDALIVFPEGTRTVPDSPYRFQRGAANIALMCDKPLIPVSITCSPPTLRKHERWYQIPVQPPLFRVRFHPPLALEALRASGDLQSRSARQLTRALEQFFAPYHPAEQKT